VHRKVRATVANAINIADALSAAGAAAVARSVRHERLPLLISIQRALRRLLAGNLVSAFSLTHGAAGQRDLAWLGVYEYFHDVCDLRAETEALRGLWLVAKNAGWMLPREDVCWLTERPNILRSDAKDRLHSARGPALQYPDGWSLYAWKGVIVPPWLIERPEDMTLEAIDRESDVHVRRCMIEIMTPEQFVASGGAVRIGEDETGILWRKIWAFDAWIAVEVINGTPGPDGMRKHFFLQVPPQMRTPRQAVAWTYGMSEEQYAHLTIRTQSVDRHRTLIRCTTLVDPRWMRVLRLPILFWFEADVESPQIKLAVTL
jgi:hypothetical protein